MTISPVILDSSYRVSKYALSLGLVCFFFSVFVRSDNIWGGDFSARQVYLYAAWGLLLMILSFTLFLHRRMAKISLNSIDILLAMFWGWCFIRSFSTASGFYLHERLFELFALLIFYFVSKTLINDSITGGNYYIQRILTLGVLSTGILTAIPGVIQVFQMDMSGAVTPYGIFGGLSNPGFYGGFLAVMAPFSLGTHLFPSNINNRDKSLKYLALSVFFSSIFTLPATLSRAAWVAASVGILILSLAKWNLLKRAKAFLRSKVARIIALPSIVALLVRVICAIYFLKPESAFGRLLVWKVTLSMIEMHPFVGVGFDRFKAAYENYQASYFSAGTRSLHERMVAGHVLNAYNDPLQIFAELGLIGGLIFILIVWKVVSIMIKRGDSTDPILYPCGASFLAFIALSLFDYPMSILPTFILFFFFLAGVSACYSSKRDVQFRLPLPSQKAISLILLSLAVVVGYHSKVLYAGYQDWQHAYESTIAGDFAEARSQYHRLLPVFGQNGEFLFMYGALLTLSKKYDEAIPILEKAENSYNDPKLWLSLATVHEALGNFRQAELELKKASNIEPHEFYPRYLLMKLLIRGSRNLEAMSVARDILSMPVKVPSPAVQQIKQEARKVVHSPQSVK